MENWSTLQQTAIEMIRQKGYKIISATKQEDYDGVDVKVQVRPGVTINVDVKGSTTLPRYGTVLISLLHSKNSPNGGGEWVTPKYLQRTDVYVWICDITSFRSGMGNHIYSISPKRLQNLGGELLPIERTMFKSWKTDYFKRNHLLAVIDKNLLETF